MPIDSGNSLIQGIGKEFKDFWKAAYVKYEEFVQITTYKLPGASDTEARFKKYAWKESVPRPKFWNYDEGRSHQMFGDVQFEVPVYPYELTLDVRKFDREHDQLGKEDARSQIQMGVGRYAQLPQNFASEQLNGAADLLPDLRVAYDGSPLFSALDGDGNNRFSAVGGNIVAGSGTNFADFTSDMWTVQQRFLQFKDPAGEILFSDDDVDFSKMFVIAPVELNQIVKTTTKAKDLRIDNANLVSQSNVLEATFGSKILNLLTDASDWFVVLDHSHKLWKPFALRQNEIDSVWADMSNSDRAREINIESLYTSQNTGMGILAPFTIIKINN